MDKPARSAQSVLNEIKAKAMAEAVSHERTKAPMVGVSIQSWTGHMILCQAGGEQLVRDMLSGRTSTRD